VPNRSRFVCSTALVLLSICSGYGQDASSAPQPPANSSSNASEAPSISWPASWWRPVVDFMNWLFEPAPAPAASDQATLDQPAETTGPCSVAPLDPIDDAAAQHLEASGGADVVDIADMVPAAALALNRFQSKVESVGGTIVLKSAYRPAAYQKHLQNVWYKWMDELRDNREPGCQALRTQVRDEFTRHRLIETQHPVAVSDHTRGLAFDATVNLPAKATAGRRRITLDGLARVAGLLRPAIAADPVHFKFLGGGGARTLVARNSGGVRTAALRRRRNA
jgi:D-alanyl-D-alanine dipeptidase